MKYFIFVLFLFCFNLFSQNITVNDITNQLSYTDFKTEITMEVGRGESSPLAKNLNVYYKENDKSQKLLAVFTYPSNMKGMAFLALCNKKDEDKWYMYIRTLRRVKKVTTNSDNFMLKDFLSLYFLKPRTELWNFSYDENQIIFTAKDEKTIEMTGYKKLVNFVDSDKKTIKKTEFYDKNNKLVRIQEVLKFEQIDNIWIPTEVTTNDKQEDVKAKLILKNIKLNSSLKDDIFTSNYLKTL